MTEGENYTIRKDLHPIFPLWRGEFVKELGDKNVADAILHVYQAASNSGQSGVYFGQNEEGSTAAKLFYQNPEGTLPHYVGLCMMMKEAGFDRHSVELDLYRHIEELHELNSTSLLAREKVFEFKELFKDAALQVYGETIQ